MSVIIQLPIPCEMQELVKQFAYCSKTEYLQRKLHRLLMRQFEVCERIEWGVKNLFYDYFYYKMENFMYCCYEKNHTCILQEISFMSAIFCKQCHQYVSSHSNIPENLICDCIPDLMEGPLAVD